MHHGKGVIRLRRFGFDNAPKPAGLVIFDIPPGASEGVHVHGIGLDTGPYDEYYFIVSGSGQMEIEGKIVPVKGGDYVHAPMGIHHGIENTSCFRHPESPHHIHHAHGVRPCAHSTPSCG